MNQTTPKTTTTFKAILDLLNRLEASRIAYRLNKVRDDAFMIEVAVPGQRWEIEFVDYGDEVHIEVEKFVSDGEMFDEQALDELFATQSS